MPIEKDSVLAHFRTRGNEGRNRVWSDMAYVLMRVILSKVEFDRVEDLAKFCDDPNNLLPWVSSESDRVIFASRLAERVREMMSQAASNAARAG